MLKRKWKSMKMKASQYSYHLHRTIKITTQFALYHGFRKGNLLPWEGATNLFGGAGDSGKVL
jgi:hypothetical protein